MKNFPEEQKEVEERTPEVGEDLLVLLDMMEEPVLMLGEHRNVLAHNSPFRSFFSFSEDPGEEEISQLFEDFSSPEFDLLFQKLLCDSNKISNYPLQVRSRKGRTEKVLLSLSCLRQTSGSRRFLLLFKAAESVADRRHLVQINRNFQNILTHAPALLCLLRGPEHVFEASNDHYLNLIGKTDIIGKKVREAIPEVEGQGFFEILDSVYSSGEPYVGEEVLVVLKDREGQPKQIFLDFLYQPTRDSGGAVDGIFVHAIDVTEKVEARRKLQESSDRLRQLIDTMPALVWLSDRDRNTSYLNKSWYKYTGQSKKETSRQGWLDLVHPEDRSLVERVYKRAHEEEREYSISFRLRNRKKQYRWVSDSAKPRYSASGDFEGMLGIVVDVHEEKLKEELVREKEHRIRSIVEEANVATALYIGEEMRIELANDAMLELWGKDRRVLGKNLREALPELEGQPFHQLLKEVFATGKTYWGQEDKVVLMKNDTLQTGYFNFTYKALKNEQGEIYGILNMALDVTEMVASKSLLKESESHFRQMANLMPEKVANTDPEGNLIYVNQNWLDYTGLSSEELQRKGWAHLIHPEEREEYNKNWQRSLETGADFEMELRFLDRAGIYKWHLSRAEAVRDESGSIRMWIGNNTEIQKLKEEEKRKEEFLKMVSHELKTPVTSVKGYVQLLLSLLNKNPESAPSPVFKSSLLRIDHQITRLTRLIGEILDISRIEESKLKLELSYFDLNELVEETVQDIRLTSTQHHISIDHVTRGTVYADRDRIGQVLINLVTNAIKYSPDSREVQVEIRSAEEGKISVTVRDKGIGIEEKNQKEIFKRFYRATGKSQETFSGFGIGLYLANEIVERHKGQLKVKSEPGKGSEFTFTLALS